MLGTPDLLRLLQLAGARHSGGTESSQLTPKGVARRSCRLVVAIFQIAVQKDNRDRYHINIVKCLRMGLFVYKHALSEDKDGLSSKS